MKSLLISGDYFPPQVGGISHLMSGITSALGPERVCCLTGQDADAGRENLGVKVYRRPAIFNAKRRSFRAAAWIASITEIMLREWPQIAQLATAGEGALGLWLRSWFGVPFVVYAHGNEVLSAMQPRGQKLRVGLQRADRVLAVSRFTANLVQQAGVSPERIEIVHAGCNVDRFRPTSPRTDLRRRLVGDRTRDKIILTVGNLVARKGQDMVIRALPRLRQIVPDVTYLIVGEGPYRVELDRLALELGVRDRVVFAGRALVVELPDIYAISDVFVMASRDDTEACDVEGFGLVFLEASACGKPVVGGRSGGISDAIEEGVTGFLVDPRDPKEIADVLGRVLTNSDLAARMGQEGQLWVGKKFTWPHVADKVQGILQAVSREKFKSRPAGRCLSSGKQVPVRTETDL